MDITSDIAQLRKLLETAKEHKDLTEKFMTAIRQEITRLEMILNEGGKK